MKHILWLSRHSPEEIQKKQLQDKFGEIDYCEKSVSINNADDVIKLMKDCNADDVVAVLPIGIMADLTKKKIKPIRANMERIIKGKDEKGQDIVEFKHIKFERVNKVNIEIEDL